MDLCYNYHSCVDKTQKCIAAALNEERILLKKRTLKIPFILLISLLRLLGVREERGFRSSIRFVYARSFVRLPVDRSRQQCLRIIILCECTHFAIVH